MKKDILRYLNFNFKQRIIALGLAGTSLFTLSGCSKDLKIEEPKPIETIEEIDDNNNLTYPFDFIEYSEEQQHTNVYDWSATGKVLKIKDKNFSHLLKNSINGTTTKNNYCSDVAVYYSENGEYCRIVNSYGLYLTESISNPTWVYTDTDAPTYISTPIEPTSYPDNDIKYTILDHISGQMITFKCLSLMQADDFIVRLSYDDGEMIGQLLYSNGNLASKNKYHDCSYDEQTKNLYLFNKNEKYTEILDTTTGIATKIEGHVVSAHNNFIVLNTENGYGVYKFVGIDKELVEIIPSKFELIRMFKMSTPNGEEMKFGCYTTDNAGNPIASIYSETGEKLSRNYFTVGDTNNSEYMMGVDQLINTQQNFLLNSKGEEIIAMPPNFGIVEIYPEIDKIIYCDIGKEGYGIMTFNQQILLLGTYEPLSGYTTSKGDIYFIGMSKDAKEITLLNSELEIIATGIDTREEAKAIAETLSNTDNLSNQNNKKLKLVP